MRFVASIVVFAASSTLPIAAMRASLMPTSARSAALPVPSNTSPPRITTSSMKSSAVASHYAVRGVLSTRARHPPRTFAERYEQRDAETTKARDRHPRRPTELRDDARQAEIEKEPGDRPERAG